MGPTSACTPANPLHTESDLDAFLPRVPLALASGWRPAERAIRLPCSRSPRQPPPQPLYVRVSLRHSLRRLRPLSPQPQPLSPLLQPPLPPQTHCYRARAIALSLLRSRSPRQPPQAPRSRPLSPLLQPPLPPQTHCYRACAIHTARNPLSLLLRPPLPAQLRALSPLLPPFLAPQPNSGICTRTLKQAACGVIIPPPTYRGTRCHLPGVFTLILPRSASGSSTWPLAHRTCSHTSDTCSHTAEPLPQTHCYRACAVHTYTLLQSMHP